MPENTTSYRDSRPESDLFNNAKQYLLFREFEEQVEARKLSDIPDALTVNKHAQAYYGVFKKELPEVFAVNDVQVQEKWTKLAFEVDSIIVKAVAENSLNP